MALLIKKGKNYYCSKCGCPGKDFGEFEYDCMCGTVYIKTPKSMYDKNIPPTHISYNRRKELKPKTAKEKFIRSRVERCMQKNFEMPVSILNRIKNKFL